MGSHPNRPPDRRDLIGSLQGAMSTSGSSRSKASTSNLARFPLRARWGRMTDCGLLRRRRQGRDQPPSSRLVWAQSLPNALLAPRSHARVMPDLQRPRLRNSKNNPNRSSLRLDSIRRKEIRRGTTRQGPGLSLASREGSPSGPVLGSRSSSSGALGILHISIGAIPGSE